MGPGEKREDGQQRMRFFGVGQERRERRCDK